jgi:selenium metabolism protein YedF
MVFTGRSMGRGSEELGRLLIQACINALPELDAGPEVLILYNSAIELAAEGSAVLGSLRTLADRGVRIYVCGTCVDYFGMKEKIRVGLISNMYEILELLSGASKIIYP